MKQEVTLYHYDPITFKFTGQTSVAKRNEKNGRVTHPPHTTTAPPPKYAAATFHALFGDWRIRVYHYDPVTHEFTGSSFEMFDPIDRKPLIPRHATLEELLCGFGDDQKRPVFNQVAQQWELVADFRGTWYTPDGSEQIIEGLGVEPVQGSTKTPPPPTREQLIAGIRKEAARRIRASGHDWKVVKALAFGKKPPKDIVAYAQAVRDSSNALEKTLPIDFTNDKYWPEVITE